jgi:hypothetical protein
MCGPSQLGRKQYPYFVRTKDCNPGNVRTTGASKNMCFREQAMENIPGGVKLHAAANASTRFLILTTCITNTPAAYFRSLSEARNDTPLQLPLALLSIFPSTQTVGAHLPLTDHKRNSCSLRCSAAFPACNSNASRRFRLGSGVLTTSKHVLRLLTASTHLSRTTVVPAV